MDASGRSSDDGPSAAVTTEDEFHEALKRLVTEAAASGIDVRGGWPIVDGSEESWALEITKLARRTTVQVDGTEFPATAITEAVAAREGVDSTDLPPLHESIGTDVLELLHESDDLDQRVRFDYYGYKLTVTSGGSITIDG